MQAAALIRVDFENAVLSLCQHPSFDHAEFSSQQIAKLMSNLLSDSNSETPMLNATQCQTLIAAAQAKYGPEIATPILQRIFHTLRYATWCMAFISRARLIGSNHAVSLLVHPSSRS